MRGYQSWNIMIIYAAFGYLTEYSYLLRAPPDVQMETATETMKVQ